MTTQTVDDAQTPDRGLFEDLAEPGAADVQRAQARANERSRGAPRVLEPNRRQVELRACALDSLLGEEHRARLVWGYVERQDLSALYEAIKARGAVAVSTVTYLDVVGCWIDQATRWAVKDLPQRPMALP